ncbi:MAG TPA: hypothetical protein PLK85_05355 [Alphaproteobacteria bacterium]|nr:hypothetical protein [Alphaproteobacteria bacterium]
MTQPRKALASGFNGNGGGGDGIDEATRLFDAYKDTPTPFTGIAKDRLSKSPMDHGSAVEKVLEYLDKKPSWLPATVDDLEHILKTPHQEQPYGQGSKFMITNAFVGFLKKKKFDGVQDFEKWKASIQISDQKVVKLILPGRGV